ETATSAAAEPVEESGSGSVKVVRYTVKRGDTLWDLARSYYKTPWRYMRIAEFNRLKNPDHIVAGTSIEIPSR
ncbi:LysM peptidoglycan-binding domain-containing protein, partial [Treponema pallidum]